MHPWTLNWDSSAIRSTLPQRGQLGLPKSRVTGFAALQANWMVIADPLDASHPTTTIWPNAAHDPPGCVASLRRQCETLVAAAAHANPRRIAGEPRIQPLTRRAYCPVERPGSLGAKQEFTSLPLPVTSAGWGVPAVPALWPAGLWSARRFIPAKRKSTSGTHLLITCSRSAGCLEHGRTPFALDRQDRRHRSGLGS
jgi:hypothetical protein